MRLSSPGSDQPSAKVDQPGVKYLLDRIGADKVALTAFRVLLLPSVSDSRTGEGWDRINEFGVLKEKYDTGGVKACTEKELEAYATYMRFLAQDR